MAKITRRCVVCGKPAVNNTARCCGNKECHSEAMRRAHIAYECGGNTSSHMQREDGGAYLPTQEEIARAAAEIRSGWTEAQWMKAVQSFRRD